VTSVSPARETAYSKRKEARMVYLRDYWAKRLDENSRVRLYTSLRPGLACGMATFSVDGIDSAELADWLWQKHRVLTSMINHDELQGLRI
jgi:selenocysteine lyase/cysteine desulfurase